MPLVADVVEAAKVRVVACDDPIALRCGELATELCLAPQALVRGPVTEFLMHRGKHIPFSIPVPSWSRSRRSRQAVPTLVISERVAVAYWRNNDTFRL